VDVPFTAAWNDVPVLSIFSPKCQSFEDNLRTRSHARSIRLMLESIALEPERFRLKLTTSSDWDASPVGGRRDDGADKKAWPNSYRKQS
jgi:hypothetical protein